MRELGPISVPLRTLIRFVCILGWKCYAFGHHGYLRSPREEK